MRVSSALRGAYDFACHSAACRPPTSGGTGGSSPKGGSIVSRPGESREDFRDRLEAESRARARGGSSGDATIDAKSSPHYKKRTAEEVGAMSQEDALALVRDKDATGRRVLDKGIEIKGGQPVGIRANLNLKKSTGITIQTVHAGTENQLKQRVGMFTGEAIGYGAAVVLNNGVTFSVNHVARAKIMTGEANKFPMASVDGRYGARQDYPDKFDGIEVRFNPMKHHLFVDPDGRPVKSAEFATVVGSSVFVRGNVEYYTADDMPKPARGLPTEVKP